MDYKKVLARVKNNKRGTFKSAVWERPCKTKKAFNNMVIMKRTEAVVRLGIEYDNIQAVKDKKASGELPEQNQGLPWGEWALFPYLISHKGNTYLRMTPSKTHKTHVTYFVNGVVTPYENIENMLLASEKQKKDDIDVFSININNIISL